MLGSLSSEEQLQKLNAALTILDKDLRINFYSGKEERKAFDRAIEAATLAKEVMAYRAGLKTVEHKACEHFETVEIRTLPRDMAAASAGLDSLAIGFLRLAQKGIQEMQEIAAVKGDKMPMDYQPRPGEPRITRVRVNRIADYPVYRPDSSKPVDDTIPRKTVGDLLQELTDTFGELQSNLESNKRRQA